MTTAIFGGTFNPFHMGHYSMLEALQESRKIDSIFVMPDNIPPHKQCDLLASDGDRAEMCRIAAEDFSKAEVCLVEFEREGRSYSFDTVNILKKMYPLRDFTFVCGGDMLVSFDKWYKYKELMSLVSFTVFRRVGTDDSEFDRFVRFFSKLGMDITVMDKRIPDISSTKIRNNVELSADLIPPKIFSFIKERGLYVV